MRLTPSPRLRRVLRALPQGGPVAWLEIALIIVLAFQLARLLWAVATPVGPFGDWQARPVPGLSADARAALFARFDPFNRTAPNAGPAVVTSLSLTLYGIRMNEASGGGSAIVAGPDGVQQSVAVGGEVMPGVVLKAVALDHVTITRGGADEQLYLDQSTPAPVAQPNGAPAAGAPSISPVILTPAVPLASPPAAPTAIPAAPQPIPPPPSAATAQRPPPATTVPQ